jgi:hypothetical protein
MTRSLRLPAELKQLVDDGLWPMNNEQAEPGASPNGGPSKRLGDSGVIGGRHR